MKKKIGYTLLVLVLLLIIGAFFGIRKFNNAIFKEKPNYLSYTYESTPIHFDWAGDTVGDYREEQAAMIIPLKIEGLSHRFYMQFDTGSPYTYIYEYDLDVLRTLGLEFNEVVKDGKRYVERFDFVLDENHIKATMVKIYPNYGNAFDKNDTIRRYSIGTIGSDFIDKRITAIDFKKQQLQFYDERPEWMLKKTGFQPFDFSGRRVMLPVILNDTHYEYLYDSGCSAFGLITTKSRYDRYTDPATETIRYDAKSWNSSFDISSKASEQRFQIGNADLSLERVSHVDMYTSIQGLITPFTRVGGWLGNQPFNESTLILDTKAEKFLVLKD